MLIANSILNSIVFLTLVSVAFLLAAFVCFKSAKRYNWVERLLYLPVYSLARTLWRVELHWDPRWDESAEKDCNDRSHRGLLLRDRMKKGAVLVANHRASIDPFFIQLAAGCRVHWMVAGEYFSHPIFGGILKSFQAIPTKRGGADNAATKMAIRLASQGKFVGMFPEGRINRTEEPLLSVRPGAALVAAKAGTPIVPIWIEGAPTGPQVYSPLFKAAHVRVYIGFPVDPPYPLLEKSKEPVVQNFANEAAVREDEPETKHTNSGPLQEPVDQLHHLTAQERLANPGRRRLRTENRSGDIQDKRMYVEWIERAMQDSLRLGKKNTAGIQHAGRSWVKN